MCDGEKHSSLFIQNVNMTHQKTVLLYLLRKELGHKLKKTACMDQSNLTTDNLNFSEQDETWVECSTLEAAACVLCASAAMKQTGLT